MERTRSESSMAALGHERLCVLLLFSVRCTCGSGHSLPYTTDGFHESKAQTRVACEQCRVTDTLRRVLAWH